jgi:hypothetical protein
MKYAKIGEDVIVIKEGVEAYDHICQIWKIGEYVDGAPKISVSGLDHNSAQYKPLSMVIRALTHCYARRLGACDRSWVGGIMIKASVSDEGNIYNFHPEDLVFA